MLLKILVTLFMSCGVGMASAASDEGYKPNLGKLFSVSDLPALVSLMEREGVIIPVPGPEKNTDVGFNQTKLGPLHCTILEAANDKEVYELGSGCGYFTAKLLAAGAKFVTAVDLSKGAIEKAREVITGYGSALKKNFDEGNHYRLMCGDVTTILKKLNQLKLNLGDKMPSPAVMTMVNLLHYLTPTTSRNALQKAREASGPLTQLYILANAPSGDDNAVNAYLTAQTSKKSFPGYLMRSRTDTLLCDPKSGKVLGKFSSVYTDSQHLGEDISPIKLERTDAEPKILATNNNDTTKLECYLKQSFFFWDMQTAHQLLEDTGWEILEAYYVTYNGSKLTKYDENEAKAKCLNLAIIAKPASLLGK